MDSYTYGGIHYKYLGYRLNSVGAPIANTVSFVATADNTVNYYYQLDNFALITKHLKEGAEDEAAATATTQNYRYSNNANVTASPASVTKMAPVRVTLDGVDAEVYDGTAITGYTCATIENGSAEAVFYYAQDADSDGLPDYTITENYEDVEGAAISGKDPVVTAFNLPGAVADGVTASFAPSSTDVTGYRYVGYRLNGGELVEAAPFSGTWPLQDNEKITYVFAEKNLQYAGISAITNQTYTGSPITPVFTVTFYGTVLASGTDFSYAFTDHTNAGQATLTITGAGEYSGSNSVSFTIDQALPTYTAPPVFSAVYGQTLGDIDISGLDDSAGVWSWKAGAATSVGDAGNNSFTLVYTPTNTNYMAVDVSASVTVSKSTNIPSGMVTTPTASGSYTYGTALSAWTLSNTDWAWVDAALVPEVGNTGYAAVVSVDDNNYDFTGVAGYDAEAHTVTRTVIVTVTQSLDLPSGMVTSPTTADSHAYGTALSSWILSNTDWAWVDGTILPEVGNSGYAAVVSVDDNNYDFTGVGGYDAVTHTVTRTVAVTVTQSTEFPLGMVTTPTASGEYAYGTALSSWILSNTDWAWVDGTIIPTVGNSGYAAVVSVDDNNYDFTGVTGYDAVTHTVTRTVAVTVTQSTSLPSGMVTTPMASGSYTYGTALSAWTLSNTDWAWVDAALVPEVGNTGYAAVVSVDDNNYDFTGVAGYDAEAHTVTRTVIVTVTQSLDLPSGMVTSPTTADSHAYGTALSSWILSNTDWAWVDGTILPEVGNSGYAAVVSVDDNNYDFTGVGGYDAEAHTVTRTVAVTVTQSTEFPLGMVTTPTASGSYVYGTALSNWVLSDTAWSWADGATLPEVGNSGYEAFVAVDDTNYDFSGVAGYDAVTHTVTRTVAVTVTQSVDFPAGMVTTPTASGSYVYGTALSAWVLSDAAWSWVDGTTVPTVGNAGYAAVVTVDDDNYDFSGVEGYDAATHTLTRKVVVTVTQSLDLPSGMVTSPTTADSHVYGTALSNWALSDTAWVWADGKVFPTVGNAGYSAFIVVDDNNYDFSAVEGYNAATHKVTRTVAVTVTLRELTVVIADRDIIYGTEVPAADFYGFESVTGWADGEDLSADIALSSLYVRYGTGTYIISAAYGAELSNYDVKVTDGTLTVKNAAITNVLENNYSGTFDGAAHSASIVSADTVNSETYTVYFKVDGVWGITAPDYTAVGSYTVEYKIEADNHDVYEGTLSVDISEAEIIFTASGYFGTYDGGTHGITVTVTGSAGGETVTTEYSADGGASWDTVCPTYTDAGQYSIMYRLTADNHKKEEGTLSVKINNADITVTENNYNAAYDGGAHSASVTDILTAGGQTPTVEYSYEGETQAAPFEFTNVGTYYVGYTVTAANHTTLSGTLTVEIGGAEIAVTANDYSAEYDGNAHTGFDITVTTAGGQAYTITYRLNADAEYGALPEIRDAGNYTLYYRITAANHTVKYGRIAVWITTASSIPHDKKGEGEMTFDGNAHSLYVENIVTSGAYTIAYTYNGVTKDTPFEFTNVGSYVVSYVISAENYDDATGTLSLVIKAAGITHDASGYTGIYDGGAHTVTVNVTGSAGGEAVICEYSADGGQTWKADAPEYRNVGNYSVRYRLIADNHAAAGGTLTVIITEAEISYDTKPCSVVYDGNNHSAEIIDITTVAEQAAKVTYSLTGGNDYTSELPVFKLAGVYTVYYRITTPNHKTEEGTLAVEIKAAELTVDAENYTGTYTGAAHDSFDITAVTVDGAEYTVEYGLAEGVYGALPEIIAAGEYVLYFRVSAANHESATGAVTVMIEAADAINYSASNYSGEYDGSEHGVYVYDVTTSDDSVATVEYSYDNGVNYSAEYSKFTDVCNLTVYFRISALNHKTVNGTLTLKITPANITFSTSGYNGNYDAMAHGASVNNIVTKGGQPYTLVYTYEDQSYAEGTPPLFTNSGTYHVGYTISAPNHNTARGVLNVVISSTAAISYSILNYEGVYDGAEHYANVYNVVTVGGQKYTVKYSVNGTDYEAALPKFSAAGEHKVFFTIEALNHETAVGTLTVKITKATLTAAAIGYSGVYDGLDHSVTVKNVTTVGGQTSVITYAVGTDNYGTELPLFKNAGTYTVTYTVSAPNHYDLTGTLTVKIDKATVTKPTAAQDEYRYTGEAVTLILTGFDEATMSVSGNAYTAAGNYTATVSLKNANYEWSDNTSDAVTIDWSIYEAVIVGVTVSGGTYVYDGSVRKAAVKGHRDTDIVTYCLTSDGVFTTEQPEMRNAGCYELYVKISRTKCDELLLDVVITIDKAEPACTAPTLGSVDYDKAKTLADISLPAGWVWDNASLTPVVKNSGYGATFTPDDTLNYNTVTVTVSLTVNKAEPPYTVPTLGAVAYDAGKTLADVTLPAGWVWDNASLTPAVGNGGYNATFTPDDTDNYKTVTKTLSLTVTRAAGAVNVPAPQPQEYGNTLDKWELTGGWTWEDGSITPEYSNDGYWAVVSVDDVNYDYGAVDGYDSATHTVRRSIAVKVTVPAAKENLFFALALPLLILICAELIIACVLIRKKNKRDGAAMQAYFGGENASAAAANGNSAGAENGAANSAEAESNSKEANSAEAESNSKEANSAEAEANGNANSKEANTDPAEGKADDTAESKSGETEVNGDDDN